MKIYCSYNEEFHIFLNKVVELILQEYGSQINISSLEEIELVNKNEFAYDTDGRVVDNSKIIVTSRLYELLPSFDIESLGNNKEYKLLKQTLYHEMGHINDMVLMPNLYKCAFSDDNNEEQIVSQFWLEYLAERRSDGFEGIKNFDLCEQFIKESWKCTMISLISNYNSKNFAYLVKVLPYFMAATQEPDTRNYYINQIKNDLLIGFISELDKEILELEKSDLFDDVTMLSGIYDIINKYYKKFMTAFRKR